MARFVSNLWRGDATAAGGDMTRHLARRVSGLGIAFAILLVIDLAAGWLAIDVVDSTRAFSVGAAFYTKSQKTAVIDLNRFVVSHAQADFEGFLTNLAVPLGDRDARLALQSDRFERSTAVDGLLRGKNPASDVAKIIRHYRLLQGWTPFKLAVADWSAADAEIEALYQLGTVIGAGPASDPSGQAAELAAIARIDDRLTGLEERFIGSMNVAAGAAKSIVRMTLILSTILLWAFGMMFAARLFNRQIALDRKLASSEDRFRDYAEVASDWYWEVDGDRKINFVSELYFTLTGASPEGVLGRDATEFLRSYAADAESWEHLIPFMAQQAVRGMRLRYPKADGTVIYLSVSAKPCFDAAGRFIGYRGVGSDITAAVEAAQNLRAEKERAEIANRAKSEFLANMSHELRTPLNAIIGFSEIIMNRVFGNNPPEKYDAYAVDINNSGKHLLSMINEILELSKVEAGHDELRESEIGLDVLIGSSRNLFGARFQLANLSFSVDLPEPAPVLRVDAGKLKQCLSNLLSNTLKFTGAGGAVSVTARFEPNGSLAIAVADTGIGIAARDIPTVLAPFGQVETAFQRSHTGTGLGLTITKALIEQHGGTLDIESTPGAGTTVTLTIPSSRIAGHALDAPTASG
jgi:PAS domain S-box-containing protein